MNNESQNSYIYVAIYGFRKNGRKIYELLMKKKVQIAYIIDRNYEALSFLEKEIDIPIIGFNEDESKYKRADAIILSDDLPEEMAKECLELSGINIPIISFEME